MLFIYKMRHILYAREFEDPSASAYHISNIRLVLHLIPWSYLRPIHREARRTTTYIALAPNNTMDSISAQPHLRSLVQAKFTEARGRNEVIFSYTQIALIDMSNEDLPPVRNKGLWQY